jgi:hypothetical protein
MSALTLGIVRTEAGGGGGMIALWGNVTTFLAIALPELAGLVGGL